MLLWDWLCRTWMLFFLGLAVLPDHGWVQTAVWLFGLLEPAVWDWSLWAIAYCIFFFFSSFTVLLNCYCTNPWVHYLLILLFIPTCRGVEKRTEQLRGPCCQLRLNHDTLSLSFWFLISEEEFVLVSNTALESAILSARQSFLSDLKLAKDDGWNWSIEKCFVLSCRKFTDGFVKLGL